LNADCLLQGTMDPKCCDCGCEVHPRKAHPQDCTAITVDLIPLDRAVKEHAALSKSTGGATSEYYICISCEDSRPKGCSWCGRKFVLGEKPQDLPECWRGVKFSAWRKSKKRPGKSAVSYQPGHVPSASSQIHKTCATNVRSAPKFSPSAPTSPTIEVRIFG
jgi:hypothetical protein